MLLYHPAVCIRGSACEKPAGAACQDVRVGVQKQIILMEKQNVSISSRWIKPACVLKSIYLKTPTPCSNAGGLLDDCKAKKTFWGIFGSKKFWDHGNI